MGLEGLEVLQVLQKLRRKYYRRYPGGVLVKLEKITAPDADAAAVNTIAAQEDDSMLKHFANVIRLKAT